MDKDNPSIFTVDFETTGKDAAEAFAIEAALACPDDGAYGFETFIALPDGVVIPPETSAIHHIIQEDIKGAPDWDTVVDSLWGAVSLGGELEPQGVVMVAHNAEYEKAALAGTIFDQCRWVCTFKCALVIWPEAPSHSNEALRYWLGMGSGRAMKQASHSALHDCKVTAGIFNALYGQFHKRLVDEGRVPASFEAVQTAEVQNAIIAEMMRVSNEPAQLPTCPIGDWRGKPWSEVDAGFLRWMINKPIDREDAIHCARQELARRAAR